MSCGCGSEESCPETSSQPRGQTQLRVVWSTWRTNERLRLAPTRDRRDLRMWVFRKQLVGECHWISGSVQAVLWYTTTTMTLLLMMIIWWRWILFRIIAVSISRVLNWRPGINKVPLVDRPTTPIKWLVVGVTVVAHWRRRQRRWRFVYFIYLKKLIWGWPKIILLNLLSNYILGPWSG